MYPKGYQKPALPNSAGQDEPRNFATTASISSACFGCRKRKLRCDRRKPKCGTCMNGRSECEYPTPMQRRISKRQRVIDLEERLAFIETALHPIATTLPTYTDADRECLPEVPSSSPDNSLPESLVTCAVGTTGHSRIPMDTSEADRSDLKSSKKVARPSLELLGLGVEEPLPPEPLQRDLFQIYFDIVHHHIPMIHQSRFSANLDVASDQQPPACLRYAMWCLAAYHSPKYEECCDVLYARARKYSEAAELQGHAQNALTIYHAQSWHLIATFEGLQGNLTSSSISTGRCVRLVQMMGLQSIDDYGMEGMKLLPPPRDPIEIEERRRTFWAAYFGDRWITIGTGWPMSISENQVADEMWILTRLPSSELAFERGMDEPGPFLSEVLIGDGASRLLSPFGGLLLAAALFGRNFTHIHDDTEQYNPHGTKGETFWHRHRELSNTLSTTFMHLPEHLRVSGGRQFLNTVFLHMSLHTSVICLYHAAAITAMRHHLGPQLMMKSVSRCVIAADEITSMMKMISHHDVFKMSPWTGYGLYIAGRVYCHDLSIDGSTKLKSQSNLEFLLLAMNAIGKRHYAMKPYTTQLESKLRNIKMGNSCQAPGVIRGLSSPPASDIFSPANNWASNNNPIPARTNPEDLDTDVCINSPAPRSITKPNLAGILLEADLDEENCPLREAASNNKHQDSSTDRERFTYSSRSESTQKDGNAGSLFQDLPSQYLATKNGTVQPDVQSGDQRLAEHGIQGLQHFFPHSLDDNWDMP